MLSPYATALFNDVLPLLSPYESYSYDMAIYEKKYIYIYPGNIRLAPLKFNNNKKISSTIFAIVFPTERHLAGLAADLLRKVKLPLHCM